MFLSRKSSQFLHHSPLHNLPPLIHQLFMMKSIPVTPNNPNLRYFSRFLVVFITKLTIIPGIITQTTKIPRWHTFRISYPHPTHVNLTDSLVKSQNKK